MRKTKVICTIGPSSQNEETLVALYEAGMNVARLNFSHGDYAEQQGKIDLIKKTRERLHRPIPIMLDTKGPEYRIGTFEDKEITLKDGDLFTFTTQQIQGNNTIVSVNYDKLMENLEPGDTILVCNGLVTFEVLSVNDTEAQCKVVNGGVLSDKKSMNFPGKVMKKDFLSKQDKSDLLFGIKNDVDFVAASFVSTKQDVEEMRKFLDENGGKEIDIIAKIENRSGVDHVEEICEIADGIMIARGDLGVEIPAYEVPAIQKYLINTCRLLGKRVITATEMLESMIHNPRPTRAEVSDVANAVYDGTSAVMLSGETANGNYPVEALQHMVQTLEFTENSTNYVKRFRTGDFTIKNNLDAVSHATCAMATDLDAKCIIVNSLTGITARMVSRFRCPVDILGMTASQKGWRKLNLSWGVTPVLCPTYESMNDIFDNALKKAREVYQLQPGDNVILTAGMVNGKPGTTNTIKVETI